MYTRKRLREEVTNCRLGKAWRWQVGQENVRQCGDEVDWLWTSLTSLPELAAELTLLPAARMSGSSWRACLFSLPHPELLAFVDAALHQQAAYSSILAQIQWRHPVCHGGIRVNPVSLGSTARLQIRKDAVLNQTAIELVRKLTWLLERNKPLGNTAGSNCPGRRLPKFRDAGLNRRIRISKRPCLR